jgi:hypothetical protein
MLSLFLLLTFKNSIVTTSSLLCFYFPPLWIQKNRDNPIADFAVAQRYARKVNAIKSEIVVT